MKRPEGCPFFLYRMALNKLNKRIDEHLRGRPLQEEIRLKPLVAALRAIF